LQVIELRRMNPPLGIMLRFLEYNGGGEMVRNVIECESVLGVYDLSAARGVYRLFETKGRSSSRRASVCGSEARLHDCNHMAPSLVAGT
jgi:hypothetical protein